MGTSFCREDGGATRARLSRFYSAGTWIEGRAERQLDGVRGWAGMRAVAAFPDLHPGRHGPVGAAFLADRLYPQLVGPDIGCGMALFRLDLPRRKLKLDKAARRLRDLAAPLDAGEARARLAKAGLAGGADALGSIGGGNHFCEVQGVEQVADGQAVGRLGLRAGDLCLLVHSGSRGLGAGVFAALEARWAEGYATGSEEAATYLDRHDAAVAWARLNRRLVAERAAEALRSDVEPICDSIHNALSRLDGGWLHRKGAAAPDRGLVPLAGSREHASFLIEAPGGPAEALGSVSHGAGRRYDRSSMHGRVGRHRSDLDAMTRNRFGGHVICEDRDLLIEEAGHAYKAAADVVADLERFALARRLAELVPLLTFKTARSEKDAERETR